MINQKDEIILIKEIEIEIIKENLKRIIIIIKTIKDLEIIKILNIISFQRVWDLKLLEIFNNNVNISLINIIIMILIILIMKKLMWIIIILIRKRMKIRKIIILMKLRYSR